jgi:subtilisin family serine protease
LNNIKKEIEMNQQDNETVNYLMSDENDEQDFSRFTDLTMSAEQSGKIQGGGINPFDDNNHGTHVAGAIGAMGSGFDRGNTLLNHNETAENDEDEDEESQSLADLAVKDDEQVKGGPVLAGGSPMVKIFLCPADSN